MYQSYHAAIFFSFLVIAAEAISISACATRRWKALAEAVFSGTGTSMPRRDRRAVGDAEACHDAPAEWKSGLQVHVSVIPLDNN